MTPSWLGARPPRVIDANPTGLTKKSSAQTCQSDSLTQSTLLSLKSLKKLKLGAKGREERSLECLGAILAVSRLE
jgi:hypothetical protein